MKEINYWEDKLKNMGIRFTKQRAAIIKVLIGAGSPLSAGNIYARLEKLQPKLKLSTVYRNLNFFVEENIVRQLNFKNIDNLYELLDGNHHQHLICIKCGKIMAIKCPLKEYEKKLSEETNYKIIEHNMEMYGICPECRKKEDS